MRFDSSTFYSIIGVVPFSRKYLHSTSLLPSIYSFSSTSKVTIRWRLTKPSSPLTKKKVPPWSQAELLAWAKQAAFASFPPPRRRGLRRSARSEQRGKPSIRRGKKIPQAAVSLGKLRWRGSPVDGFASGRITPLATRQVASPRGKEKARMLPWDAAPPAPPSSFHGKGTRPRTGTGGRCCLAAYAGDGESYLEKSLRGKTAAFAECVSGSREEKGGRREGSWKNEGGKEKLLAKAVTLYRTLSCWFHSRSVSSCRGMVHSP